jgi:hypothetical protein
MIRMATIEMAIIRLTILPKHSNEDSIAVANKIRPNAVVLAACIFVSFYSSMVSAEKYGLEEIKKDEREQLT